MPQGLPLEPAEQVCRDLGRLIGGACPKGWGFFLTVFSFNRPDGAMTYVSNANRDDAIKMLRELAGRMESGEGAL